MSTEGTHTDSSRGSVSAAGVRVALLVARFNSDITERLLAGALECLREHGAAEADVAVFHVPGAWELPQAAARILELGAHDALVALGCVIRGETPHFEYVCDEANRGLGAVARGSSVPVAFGVLTTEDHAQALARAGAGDTSHGNKGYDAALSVLQMVALYRGLGSR
ncbi:MAG: 6,7-dimethyl-8-ribityllumazine synthase [Gemmatimonadetes bacterium]|nr:6,7-dimethyl-8-ribityllumazine synthase [Gemmatimonadota bacterium]